MKLTKFLKISLWISLIICEFIIFFLWYKNNVETIESSPNNSIVRILTCQKNNYCISGSGSIISWNEQTKVARIGTALHVVSKSENQNLQILNKNQQQLYQNNFAKWNIVTSKQDADAAVIEVVLKRVVKPYVYKLGNLNIGESVTVKGYPQSAKNHDLQSLINVETSSINEFTNYYSIDANTTKTSIITNKNGFRTKSMGNGNSGGPVLNQLNEIVGFISSGKELLMAGDNQSSQVSQPIFESFAANSNNWNDGY